MLKKLNTALRLLVVGLLIYPLPIAIAQEVTVNEDFSDSTYQAGLTISGGNSNAFIYTNENNQYGTTGNSLGISSGTYSFEFSSDIDVYEVGFIVGAVNYAWSIKWYYADGTSETVSKNAQSNSNLSTMYETIYKSYTDYNAVDGNTDKFITKFEVILSDLSLLDTLYWQYDDSTATGSFATTTTTTLVSGIGDPSNLSVSANLHSGDISIDWDGATGYQYDAERYAIAFSNDNFQSMNYAVATGNVGSANALNTEYTFTKTYLDSEFDAGDTIYFKIRADNDTDSQYSNWTAVASYTILDVAAGVTNLTIENTEYQGLKFTWTNPGTGWSSPTSYKIEYSDGDNTWNYDDDDVYSQNISDASLTTYNLESITAGTYWFSFYACTQNGSWCHGNQGTSPVQITVNATTPTTTTTIVYTLGPPMNPVVTQEYNVGVKVDWDAPNTGNGTVSSYELYYRTDAENETVINNITETEYTIPYANIPNGTYEFSIRAIDSNNSINSGYSTEPTLNVFNQKAQDDADAAAAEAARKAEEERIAKEKAEAEAELQRQRDKNLAETGYSETDAERSAREQKEYEEEQARLKALEEERIRNSDETGYYETNSERADREQREYEEEQARLAELERQRISNEADTGIYETDAERSERERLEIEEAARKATIAATKATTDGEGDGEPLTKDEQDKLDLLVDTIIDLKKTLDPEQYAVEEEVFEIKEIVVVTTTTTTTTTTIPIIEDFADEEDKSEPIETDPLDSGEGDEEIQLTAEEVEILVEEVEEAITEVVDTEELEEVFESQDIEIIEEKELEELSEEEAEAYVEAVEEAVAEVVAELETEELVEVVEQVATADVQNLATADTQTKAVVKAVVQEVTKVETVAELNEEEKEVVGELLGFSEESAADDVELIAEAASKEENIATAVEEYVERAIDNADVENFTLADVVTEVQIEAFISDPVGAIIDVDLESIDFATIGQDMTQDQRQKSKEVVVPVIIASQIVAQAGALISRRPF